MFSDKEKKLLEKYVSSVDDDVFAVKGMEGMVGAAYARYSRAKGGFKDVLLNEFIKEGQVDPEHADQLIDRILVAYGDDSVGELEGAHVSFENVSAIGEKAIVDHRIGGAFIVQSTRYVYFDERGEDGNYRYYRDPKIMDSPLAKDYLKTMDLCFDTYARLLKPIKKYLKSKKSIDDAEYDINGGGKKEKLSELKKESDIKAFKRTYNFDLRAKACDTLRVLLPLSTFHNVGVFGNGRFYQGMLNTFYTQPLAEMIRMGELAHKALNQFIPRYVKRAKASKYVQEIESNMQKLTDDLLQSEMPEAIPEVNLLKRAENQEEHDIKTTALMLYAYSNLPLTQLIKIVAQLSKEKLELIRKTYLGDRKTRRDRPGRALEDGYPYTFDLLVTYQVFKDLQRHRMTSQLWQKFTPLHGFHIPEELKELGLEEDLLHCNEETKKLYQKLVNAGLRNEAQYVVLHGHKTRWVLQANDRELMHMLELRTTPQGHPEYRMIAQKMHQEIKKRSPWRADMMKFVDYDDHYWSRADSEAKQRVKEKQLDDKLKQKEKPARS